LKRIANGLNIGDCPVWAWAVPSWGFRLQQAIAQHPRYSNQAFEHGDVLRSLENYQHIDIIGKSGASCFARPGSKFSDVDVVRSLEGVQRSRDARQLPPSKCDSHNTHTHQAQREPDAHHFAEVPSYSRDDGELKETRTPINHLKEVVGGRGGRAPRVSNPDLGYHLISPEHLAAIASKTPLRVGEKGALA